MPQLHLTNQQFIAYEGVPYIRGLAVLLILTICIHFSELVADIFMAVFVVGTSTNSKLKLRSL